MNWLGFITVVVAVIGVLGTIDVPPPIWWSTAFVLIFLALTVYHLVVLAKDPASLRASLEQHQVGEIYRSTVKNTLSWTGKALPPTAAPIGRRKGGLGWQLDYAFSNNAMGFFLVLAFAYPIVAAFIEYAFWNGSGRIGALPMFAEGLPQPLRIGALCALAFGGALLLLGIRNRTFAEWDARWGPVSIRGIIKLAMILGGSAFIFLSAVANAIVAGIIVVVAVSVSTTGAAAGAVSIAFCIACAFGVAVAFSGVDALAGAGTVAGALAFIGALTSIVIFSSPHRSRSLLQSQTWRRIIFPLQSLLTAVIVAITLSFFPSEDILEAGNIFLFLIILPLTNAIFDFSSFGVTRLLLWRASTDPGQQSAFRATLRIAGYSIVDLIIASMLLILLGVGIVTFIFLLNMASNFGPTGADILDLQNKFDALRSSEDRPEWIYVMHFSTFLPSLVHFAIMLYAAPVALLPRAWNDWAASKITTDFDPNSVTSLKIAAWQSLRWAFPIAVVFFSAWFIFSWGSDADNLSYIGRAFLWPVEKYAHFIGAL